MAQKAGQEEREARTEAGEALNTFSPDTERSMEECHQDSDLPSMGLGEALDKVKKKRSRRKHRKSQVTGLLALDYIDHELDNLAESSQRGLVTDNTEDKVWQEANAPVETADTETKEKEQSTTNGDACAYKGTPEVEKGESSYLEEDPASKGAREAAAALDPSDKFEVV